MKYLLSSFILLFGFTIIHAQGIQFFEGDLAALKEEARKENKIIFIDAYTVWCGPCKWMAKNSFPDEKVGAFFNENFISYQLDMEKGEGLDFAKKYHIRAYPTLMFIDAEGNLVHKFVGSDDAEGLLQVGMNAADPEKNIGGMIAKYKAGERDMTFIRKYLMASAMAMIDVKEAADWYFYLQDDKALRSKENVELIMGLIEDPNHKAFQFLINNQDECQALVEYPVGAFIDQVYSRSLGKAAKKGDDAYAEAVAALKASGYKDAEKLLVRMEFTRLLRAKDKDWKVITKKIDRYFDKYAPDDAGKRNELAWRYYTTEEIQDKKLLKVALKWAKKSVALEEGYANTDTYAALLYKMGKKKEATAAAKRSIELAKKEGADASETEALLKKINKL